MKDLTVRIAAELVAHEGIALEAYKDSVGVWTWSVGVTDASGHKVFPRYKDHPASLSRCLEIFVWLIRTKYLPEVLAAFGAHDLTESELAAALSFHWNTGAIRRATWVQKVIAGDMAGARRGILEWARPASLLERRKHEAALFFDGVWTGDGTALVYDVAKPSYRPMGAKRTPIMAALQQVMGGQ